MFIRYNSTNKFWEYDTSGPQNGTGPWVVLPVDYTKLLNLPAIPPPYVLPSNVAFKDIDNNFSTRQTVIGNYSQVELRGTAGTHSGVLLNDVNQVVDQRKWRMINYQNNLRFDSVNDAENAVVGSIILFDKNGKIYERGRSASMGQPVAVPFNASSYGTYPGGTWTISAANIQFNSYSITGNTAIYTFISTGSILTASAVTHLIIINPVPNFAASCYGVASVKIGTTIGICYCYPGDPAIYVNMPGTTYFPADTGDIRFSIPMLATS